MAAESLAREKVLVEVNDGEESRRVTMLEGESLVLLERTSGPDTEVAYGAWSHTHKMTFSREAGASALGVAADDVERALGELFDPAQGEALLADVMDRFDQSEAKYTYLSWSDDGDIAYRA